MTKGIKPKSSGLFYAVVILAIGAIFITSSALLNRSNNISDSTTTSTPIVHAQHSASNNRSQTKSKEYPHDDSKHPWYWSREGRPSDVESARVDCDGRNYGEMYDFFHKNGYVIFTSCSLNSEEGKKNILEPNARIASKVKPVDKRIQDTTDEAALALSLDKDIVDFMEYIHGGRRAFPFQSLHFPVGTEQPAHSDIVHFDTMPRSLMSAAWTALEDMNENNGPLRFFPQSHHYGVWDGAEVGVHFAMNNDPNSIPKKTNLYGNHYGTILEEKLSKLGIEPTTGHEMNKGQTLIWAASLVHGGSEQKDKSLSRLSTVIHYFFEGAEYFWSPIISTPQERSVRSMTPCLRNEALSSVMSCADMYIEERKQFIQKKREIELNGKGQQRRNLAETTQEPMWVHN